jgi:thymidylate kinase
MKGSQNTLAKIRKLVEALNTSGLRYCHWKSNLSLAEALSGQTDVDLLVHRNDAGAFRTLLGRLCFRPAVGVEGESFPSLEHYFALDEESGVLAHVHAYYRVITGESLSKNYRFPVEEMLLQNTQAEDSIRVPAKSAELVVFTLRMMLKHTSLVELALLLRDWEPVNREARWLLENDPLAETLKLLEEWLPAIDTRLFSECVAALKSPAPLLRRIRLGFQLRSQLKIYARHSPLRAGLSGVRKFSIMLLRRLFRPQKGLIPSSGGAVIAFVGPEATGKSTLLAETRRWLGEHFTVSQIHAGKPKSTALTVLPNLLVPTLRFVLPRHRSSRIETQYVSQERSEASPAGFPLLFGVRSVLLAYDRRALLAQAFAQAANGKIVLCDRYPSSSSGAPDSPQLARYPISQSPLRRWLARTEQQLYREIPRPDLVISLSVPVEVAVARNKTRGKEEPEDYLRMRHAQSSSLEFENTSVCKIDTSQPLDQTVLAVKKAIWNAL